MSGLSGASDLWVDLIDENEWNEWEEEQEVAAPVEPKATPPRKATTPRKASPPRRATLPRKATPTCRQLSFAETLRPRQKQEQELVQKPEQKQAQRPEQKQAQRPERKQAEQQAPKPERKQAEQQAPKPERKAKQNEAQRREQRRKQQPAQQDEPCGAECAHPPKWLVVEVQEEFKGVVIGQRGSRLFDLTERHGVQARNKKGDPKIHVFGRECRARAFVDEICSIVDRCRRARKSERNRAAPRARDTRQY
ncbi:activating signal cointegrator 1 complex subunit 2 homolog isoform X2 [Penaeus chinensis]|uniref:activating signal cointegrator 1 complex subunit 2 homolog isoform X1 n=1 Tax=Penaeus chinensis TaxID=139456 RepID=UPI001FB75C12|nr:activating signal cointegrator 1 complex subunit 2 homolog isoform X1 [Penaeus chinensis]XP_047477892.1 activating signal cointegrator 1 complex subunit 2 homolog isoform X2 [Penaeus chinensis]